MSFAFAVLLGSHKIRLIEVSMKARPLSTDISVTRDRVRAIIVSIRLRDAASRASSIGVKGTQSTITTSTGLIHPIVRLSQVLGLQGGIVGFSMGTITPVLVGQYLGTTLEVPGFGQFGYVGGVVSDGRHDPVLHPAMIHVGGMAMIPPEVHLTGGFGFIVFVGFISTPLSIGQYTKEFVVASLEVFMALGQFGYVGVIGGVVQ